MDEELVLVPHPTNESNCALICGDEPNPIEWDCARFGTCVGDCTAGPYKVWIKQSDMTRYLALRLVS